MALTAQGEFSRSSRKIKTLGSDRKVLEADAHVYWRYLRVAPKYFADLDDGCDESVSETTQEFRK
jgi:hypothetical protein